MVFAKRIVFLSFLSFSFVCAEDFSVFVLADEQSARFTAVTIKSILKNAAQNDTFMFFVADKGLSEESRIKLQNLEFDGLCHVKFVSSALEDENCFRSNYDRYMIMQIKKYISMGKRHLSMEEIQKFLFYKYLEQTEFYSFQDLLLEIYYKFKYKLKLLFKLYKDFSI